MNKIIILVLVILVLTGCSKNKITKNNLFVENENFNKSIKITNSGKLLGYAHMLNGTKLLKIYKDKDTKIDKNVEVIKITSSGFYPNFSIPTNSLECAIGDGAKKEYGRKPLCYSYYSEVNSGSTLFVNTFATLATGGLNLAKGYTFSKKSFDDDKFLDVIKKNDLNEYRIKLIKIHNFIDNVQKDLKRIYNTEYQAYKSNLSNITISDKTIDKSGLLGNKKLKSDYTIKLNPPKEKSYTYTHLLDMKNFINNSDQIKENIFNKVYKDKQEYTKYVKDSFAKATYTVSGKKHNTIKHNYYVEFNCNYSSQKTVKYIPNKKQTIPVKITVRSVNLNNMVPNTFTLANEDIKVEFDRDNYINSTIKSVFHNNLKKYLSILSLTSYYNNAVYNNGYNKELAPVSFTNPLHIHNLLSYNIKTISQYKNITKKKAKNTFISYGYALKYKTKDTNVEKTIYDQKKYSLYDVAKQYL